MHLQYKDFEKIINIGIRLSTEKDRNRLLRAILDNGMEITNCDASTLYLYEDGKLVFKFMKTLSQGVNRGMDKPIDDLPPVPMKEEKCVLLCGDPQGGSEYFGCLCEQPV